jgi:hypothetical protein
MRMPSDEELAQSGFSRADYETEEEVWEENFSAYLLFSYMHTQWWMGFSGPTGLNYGVLMQKLDRMKLSDEDRDVLEDDVRIMEREALRVMHKK